MRGLDPRIHQTCKSPFPKSMDCRVKPGNDEGPFSFRGLTRSGAQLPVKNRPETGSPRRRHVSTSAGWFLDRPSTRPVVSCGGFVLPNCAALPCPHAEEPRGVGEVTRGAHSHVRCGVSKHKGKRTARPHPSRRASARSRGRHDRSCALLRMRTSIACCTAHDVKQPVCFVPAARFAPGFCTLLRQPHRRRPERG
jgi:hypothetical protein